MKILKITGKYAKDECLIDDQDYANLSKYTWYISKQGYVYRNQSKEERKSSGNSNTKRLSRLLLCAKEGEQVDHINGNKLDNRKSNLRIATHAQNQRNRPKFKRHASSIYKGVYWHNKKRIWRTSISYENKIIYIGEFKSELSAAMAYDIAAHDLFGEYAKLNFPTAIHG